MIMQKLVCIYFEGNDSKIALFSGNEGSLSMIKAASFRCSPVYADIQVPVTQETGKAQAEMLRLEQINEEVPENSLAGQLSGFLKEEDLKKTKFVVILTEPALHYQKMEAGMDSGNSLPVHPKANIDSRGIEYIRLSDNSQMAIYLSGRFNFMNVFANISRNLNQKRLNILSVKSAEISLAGHVSENKGFTAGETSLILYVGKDYTKMLFTEGRRLRTIAQTLQMGKESAGFYSAISSKIFLAMDHEGIAKLDNIVVCGEDHSEKLLEMLVGNYKQTAVSVFEPSGHGDILAEGNAAELASEFAVPIAAAHEAFLESDKQSSGINLLPESVRQEQKLFHFKWYDYSVIALIFLSVFYLSFSIVSSQSSIKALNSRLVTLEIMDSERRELREQIDLLQEKLVRYEEMSEMLDAHSQDYAVWSGVLKSISDFAGKGGDMWITNLTLEPSKSVKAAGFSFNRKTVTRLAGQYESSLINSVVFEPIKEEVAYKYDITVNSIK